MKEFFPILAASPLFSGVTEDELDAMLTCLAAKTEQFPKDVFLLHPGDTVEEIGMVLSGCALVVQEDIWGNRNILSRTGADLRRGLRLRAEQCLQRERRDRNADGGAVFECQAPFDGLSLRLRAPQPHHPKPSERPCGKKPAAQ